MAELYYRVRVCLFPIDRDCGCEDVLVEILDVPQFIYPVRRCWRHDDEPDDDASSPLPG